ncbi:hypothetical protein N7533_010831 [Penicillium manginii]|uniref:uncharacterized protein n=1 Tax=Penicillium manginii TaxID=203109 RepID=UPI0025486276|nr:uncharacterized protein N7533_010831 [Penicillium manginii]KAJ5741422.1 hypothetical protein N7533_010831 [Penicillium manginii]
MAWGNHIIVSANIKPDTSDFGGSLDFGQQKFQNKLFEKDKHAFNAIFHHVFQDKIKQHADFTLASPHI